jgi:anti-sigma factor RsiW
VRCSWCEKQLDSYLEGTLPPRLVSSVEAHLRDCSACRAIIEQARVVDALLNTTRSPDLAPNFTFAVMAHVRELPISTVRSPLLIAWLSFYLVAAWIALSGAYALFGRYVPALAAPLRAAQTWLASLLATTSATAHAVAPLAPPVLLVGITALLVDAVLAIGVLVFYRTVRPRLAARLAPVERS